MNVRVYGDNIEKALKVLKLQLQRTGLFKEMRQRSFYEKPSERKKRKRREAKRKEMKALRFKRLS